MSHLSAFFCCIFCYWKKCPWVKLKKGRVTLLLWLFHYTFKIKLKMVSAIFSFSKWNIEAKAVSFSCFYITSCSDIFFFFYQLIDLKILANRHNGHWTWERWHFPEWIRTQPLLSINCIAVHSEGVYFHRNIFIAIIHCLIKAYN